MGLFDRKKKVREPEPPPGQPPISTSRPRQSLQKQNPNLQQQQQPRGQQISDPILYDPNYQGQQGGGPFGSRSRGSVIQEERGAGGGGGEGGQQQWDPPQRTAGLRDSQYENQRNSVASDRDWVSLRVSLFYLLAVERLRATRWREGRRRREKVGESHLPSRFLVFLGSRIVSLISSTKPQLNALYRSSYPTEVALKEDEVEARRRREGRHLLQLLPPLLAALSFLAGLLGWPASFPS